MSRVVVSTPTAPILRGEIEGDFAAPVVTQSPVSRLAVALPAGSITTTGTASTYQWYRDGVAIAFATTNTFQLSAADYGHAISARVVVSKSNFTTKVLVSVPVDYSIVADAVPVISGVVRVGEVVSVGGVNYFAGGNPVVPTVSYQWLRNGVVIVGAVASSYVVASADLAARLSVRVTASSPGWVSRVVVSPVTVTAVVAGVWQGSFAVPVVSAGPTGVLSVVVPAGSITTPGATFTYQWLRDGVAVTGATLSTFKLTAADVDKDVSVRVTATKLAMVPTTKVLVSVPVDYSIVADAVPVISGVVRVGEVVSVGGVNYFAGGNPVVPTVSYQWLRNGVVIVGAVASSYVVASADLAARLSVRVTASSPGWVSRVVVSPVTVTAVVAGVWQGSFAVPVVSAGPTGVLSVVVPAGSITTPGATFTYQWLRDGVAVTGATLSTFKLTAADVDKDVSVRVTATKLAMVPTTKVLVSVPVDYSIVADAVPVISGVVRVGEVVSVGGVNYFAGGNPVVPTVSYQWLRNGVVIVGAVASSYVVASADLAARLSVRVTASSPGWVSRVVVSPVTVTAVVAGVWQGSFAVPVVSAGPTGVLSVVVPAGSITTPGATFTYQWLRDGVAVTGATLSTFKLTAADVDKDVSVRVTATKLAMVPTTKVLVSVPVDYSIVADAVPVISGVVRVGEVVSVGGVNYFAGGNPVVPTVSYQWLRNGVVIVGAVASSYALVVADLGKAVSVRVVASAPGLLSSVAATALSGSVTLGEIDGDRGSPVVSKSSPATLTVALAAGSVTEAGTTLSYQWLRNGAPVAGATTGSYILAAPLDYAAEIRVRVTITKAGFAPLALESPSTDFSIYAVGAPTIVSSTPAVGDVLTVDELPAFNKDSVPWVPDVENLAYQWYVNGVAVVGATGIAPTFSVSAANLGRVISVRVTARATGYLSGTQLSMPTAPVS